MYFRQMTADWDTMYHVVNSACSSGRWPYVPICWGNQKSIDWDLWWIGGLEKLVPFTHPGEKMRSKCNTFIYKMGKLRSREVLPKAGEEVTKPDFT